MEVNKGYGKSDNDNSNNNDKENNDDKVNDKGLNIINNNEDDSERGGKYNEKEGNNKKEGNKERRRKRQRTGLREDTVCAREEPTLAMRWEARRQRGKTIIGAEDDVFAKVDSLHGTKMARNTAALRELQWEGWIRGT